MERIDVRVRVDEHARDLPLPDYQSDAASGMDLLAANTDDIVLAHGDIALIPTGLHISLPIGYEAQVRPRSGLALKHGLTIVNSPGTIDADYRGEICVILANIGGKPFVVERGMRIAQMVIAKVTHAKWVQTDELDDTARGECVDEEALLEALEAGQLFAFLDVTDPEPAAPDSPLRKLPNVVLTSHIAGPPRFNMGRQAVDDIESFLKGDLPLCVAREEDLDRIA